MKRSTFSLGTPLIIALLLLWLPFAASGQTLQIDPVKANHVEGFMEFVKFNRESPPANARIAVIQDRNVAEYLERIVSQNGQNSYQIVRLNASDITSIDCGQFHAIFVGAGIRKHWAALVERTKECSSLIIGEESTFLQSGGCIEFIVIKNRVRFRVNLDNLEKRNIQLSSKLLELAIE